MTYDPKDYWEKRLSNRFTLVGVGHIAFSASYNKWLYRAKTRALDKALRALQIDVRGKTVCDLGCGTGFFVDLFKRLEAKDILGVDITAASTARLAEKYPECVFVNHNIASADLCGLLNRQFDIVCAFDVLYHITDDNAFRQALANMAGLTSDSGVIFLTDLCGPEDIRIAEHVQFHGRARYNKLFSDSGMRVAAVHPLYNLLNRRLLSRIKLAGSGRIGRMLDNCLAPLYYLLDAVFLSSETPNLKLVVARKLPK